MFECRLGEKWVDTVGGLESVESELSEVGGYESVFRIDGGCELSIVNICDFNEGVFNYVFVLLFVLVIVNILKINFPQTF